MKQTGFEQLVVGCWDGAQLDCLELVFLNLMVTLAIVQWSGRLAREL
jgi:hypothetical protein